MQPLVSVIVPTFNRAGLIGQTLDSISEQDYEHWECLIIDDGSTDNTEAIVNNYVIKDARFKYYRRPENRPKGANACRNYGLEMSLGHYVNWFDSDDIMDKNHLQTHINIHQKADKTLNVSVSNAKIFKISFDNIIRDWSVLKTELNLMVEAKVIWPICCVFWKKDSLNEKPFHEDLASSQDWTFHVLQMIKGVNYQISQASTCLIRNHDQRIGTDFSQQKIRSTYMSRRYVFELLVQQNKLTPKLETFLLLYVLKSFRDSIKNNYRKNVGSIVLFLLKNLTHFSNKGRVLKAVCIAWPIYAVSGKGQKLFRI